MSAGALSPGGALSRSLPGYEDRPEQREMARRVAAALEDRRPLLVEAGTGTGKTLAYLVPTLESGRRVVVSTGTRTLQEQLVGHDLPLLEEILGRPITAVTLKGVSNYVCRRKLSELERSLAADLFADAATEELLAWAHGSASGDRSEQGALADDDPRWEAITTTAEARLGPRCPFFDRCFVTRARRDAERADLVVVNHHLFFADLALRSAYPGARVLPDYEAVIFDEAHQLEEVLTEHFGAGVSTVAAAQLCRDLARDLGGGEEAARLLDHFERCAAAFFARIREGLADRLAAEAPRVELPAELLAAGAVKEAWLRLDTALEEIACHAALRAERLAAGAETEAGEQAAALSRRAERMRDQLALVAERDERRRVYWGEARGRAVFLRASPVDVAPILRDELLGACPAAVFTSATLRAAGSFAYTRRRLGLDPEAADELALPSSFDYESQALLYVPRDLPLPAEPGFAEACAGRIAELLALTGGAAFVLFTTHRALRAAAALLSREARHPLLVQGQRPRGALLSAFRADERAVLLGTGSFWEGVDVPGLRLVVLDKLPFAPPDDPLVRARMARLEEEGGDPFSEHAVPQAALALRQGFGRLIRRRDDRGVAAVLDRRIVTRRYGRAFLDTLPAGLPRTSALEQVRRWWRA